MQNYGEIVAENRVKYESPDGFVCMHILSKFNFCRGSAPDPAGRAYNAPQTP